MTQVGVVIGNMSFVFDTTVHDENFVVALDKQLKLVKAKVRLFIDGDALMYVRSVCASGIIRQ